jgi:transposase
MAIFVRDALAGVLDRVIVCETRENRLISRSEDKSDEQDAWRLARLLRLGEFKEVHIPARPRQEVRELIHAYQKAVGDVVRAKNRIRALFRKHGVRVTGRTYGEGRHEALQQLRRPGLRPVFDAQYGVLDAAEEAKEGLGQSLRQRLAPTKEYRLLLTIPGVGPVCAAIMVAIIDTPRRFPDKRHLWSYAGLGASERSTGKGPVMKRGMYQGNRLLKYAAMVAAEGAIKHDNRFARYFRAATEEDPDPRKTERIRAAMARKTVARAILATALAMWKTGTEYRESAQAQSA